MDGQELPGQVGLACDEKITRLHNYAWQLECNTNHNCALVLPPQLLAFGSNPDI